MTIELSYKIKLFLGQFSLLPDSEKLKLLEISPWLAQEEIVQFYLDAANSTEEDLIEATNDWFRRTYDKLAHSCQSIPTMQKTPRGCFCRLDPQIRNAWAAHYLATKIGDGHRQAAARDILHKKQLLYRGELEGDVRGPLVIHQDFEGNYQLTLIMRDLRFNHDVYFVRIYDITYSTTGLELRHRLSFDPALGNLRSFSMDQPEIIWNWEPAVGSPPKSSIRPYRPAPKPRPSRLSVIPWLHRKASASPNVPYGHTRLAEEDDPQSYFVWPQAIAINPDSDLIAIGLWAGIVEQPIRRIVRILRETGRSGDALEEVSRLAITGTSPDFWVKIEFSSDGELMAVLANSVSMWKIQLEQGILKVAKAWEHSLRGMYHAMAFTSNGYLMVREWFSGEDIVLCYDTSSGEIVRKVEIRPISDQYAWAGKFYPSFSKDGNLIAMVGETSNHRVQLFDTRSGKGVETWQLKEPVRIRIWGGSKAITEDEIASAASRPVFNSCKPLLAIGTKRGSVLLLNLATRETRVLHGHADSVYLVNFSPDGKMLVSASSDGAIAFWTV